MQNIPQSAMVGSKCHFNYGLLVAYLNAPSTSCPCGFIKGKLSCVQCPFCLPYVVETSSKQYNAIQYMQKVVARELLQLHLSHAHV